MNLRILTIADRGIPNKERLHLAVDAFANLSYYAVFDTIKFPNGTIAPIPKHVFWFSAFQVKPGDNIILYTGPGQFLQKPRGDLGTNYFFHWGLQTTIWRDANSCAVLLEIGTWVTSP